MNGLILSYNAVLALVSVVLGLVLTFFLLRLRNKQRHTWLLIFLFANFTLMMASFSLVLSLQGKQALSGLYAVLLVDVGLALLIQFAYHFPVLRRPREARVALMVNLAGLALAATFLPVMLQFTPDGRIESFQSWLYAAMTVQAVRFLEFGWVFVIWTRKLLFEEKLSQRPILLKLLAPEQEAAKTIRAFLLCFSLVLILPFSVVLQYTGLVGQDDQALIFSVGIILVFAVFFLTYINYMPEQSSFMVKVVGTSLLIALASVTITGKLASQAVASFTERQCLDDLERFREHLRSGSPAQLSQKVRYVISRDVMGVRYQTHYARDPNFDPTPFTTVDINNFERRVEMQALLRFLTRPSESLAEARSKIRFEEAQRPPELLVAQSRLTDRQWVGVHDYDVHYDFTEDSQLYQVGFSSLDLIAGGHSVNLEVLVLALATTFCMLLAFPLFFQRNLSRPIADLMAGVAQVNEGRLDVEVPVHAGDEIGIMAQAFNKMVSSIATAHDEALVQERERARLAAENDRKSKELEDARRLQLSMLPSFLPEAPGLKIATYCNPATEVGGDYYDFDQIDDQLIVIVGDATGHGLQAGTMVTATKTLIKTFAKGHKPESLLRQVSSILSSMGFQGLFMAMTAVRIEAKSLQISSAGMPYPLLYSAKTGEAKPLQLRGMPLGTQFSSNYQTLVCEFDVGDTLLLLSDGLEERFNPNRETLTEARVLARFREIAHLEPEQIIEELVAFGEHWSEGLPQGDDVTMVVLQRKPTPKETS